MFAARTALRFADAPVVDRLYRQAASDLERLQRSLR
jgi:hypothetical protein